MPTAPAAWNVISGEGTLASPFIAATPPAAHFAPPTKQEIADFFAAGSPDAVHVMADGRVMHRLTPQGACHLGYVGQCVSPPQIQAAYQHFNSDLGSVVTAEGDLLPVGPLTGDAGHAHGAPTPAAIKAHYNGSADWSAEGRGVPTGLPAWRGHTTASSDNTGKVVASIRYHVVGDDIWGTGHLSPHMNVAKVAALRAAGASGDWLEIERGKGMILLGTVCVPQPGMRGIARRAKPKARMRSDAAEFAWSGDEFTQLVASAEITVWNDQDDVEVDNDAECVDCLTAAAVVDSVTVAAAQEAPVHVTAAMLEEHQAKYNQVLALLASKMDEVAADLVARLDALDALTAGGTAHDPSNGRFTSGGAGSAKNTDRKSSAAKLNKLNSMRRNGQISKADHAAAKARVIDEYKRGLAKTAKSNKPNIPKGEQVKYPGRKKSVMDQFKADADVIEELDAELLALLEDDSDLDGLDDSETAEDMILEIQAMFDAETVLDSVPDDDTDVAGDEPADIPGLDESARAEALAKLTDLSLEHVTPTIDELLAHVSDVPESLLAFNPNHAADGKFSSGGGGSADNKTALGNPKRLNPGGSSNHGEGQSTYVGSREQSAQFGQAHVKTVSGGVEITVKSGTYTNTKPNTSNAYGDKVWSNKEGGPIGHNSELGLFLDAAAKSHATGYGKALSDGSKVSSAPVKHANGVETSIGTAPRSVVDSYGKTRAIRHPSLHGPGDTAINVKHGNRHATWTDTSGKMSWAEAHAAAAKNAAHLVNAK